MATASALPKTARPIIDIPVPETLALLRSWVTLKTLLPFHPPAGDRIG